MWFTGFELMEAFPDETTLCRFRNELSQLGLDKKLFAEINRQLEQRELKVKKCEGALIDATVIESCARPRRIVEEITQDRQEENSSVSKEASPEEKKSESAEKTETPSQYVQTESCDPDARWLKKGKRYYFGYKGFARVDKEGYIEHVHVTSANRAEVKELEHALDGAEKHRRVYTDKAYPSKENNELLIRKQLKNGIMNKAVKNKGLNHWQKLRNYLISKVRFRVEQCFGTLKRKFRFTRAAYKTIAKVETQFILKAMCYNLLKAARKLEWAT